MKKVPVEHLYAIADGEAVAEAHEPKVVIRVDEFGPLNLQPRPGRQWAARSGKASKPGREPRRRMRATYTCTDGVRHLFADYDLHQDMRIDAQLTALRYFALDGTDHKQQGSMIRSYIVWRNQHAHEQRLRHIIAKANVAWYHTRARLLGQAHGPIRIPVTPALRSSSTRMRNWVAAISG